MLKSLFIGNRDGGITNTFTEVPYTDDPVVIIGLGGTGIDAINRLKTKLHRHIEPNNKKLVEQDGAMPEYARIKFLGIDVDSEFLEKSGLEKEEKLIIQKYNDKDIFNPKVRDVIKKQKEMQWMSIDYISNQCSLNVDNARVYRQVRRFLTIVSAEKIRDTLTDVITKTCEGNTGSSLSVHIISDISGGMGSGSFMDICYITRYVIDELGFTGANVSGYFVLPKDGIDGYPITTAIMKRNGIAALLEIEHLMNLEDSNDWFEQDYGTFRIHTQHKLVDICNFISSTRGDGELLQTGYEYVINVIADYIVTFITGEWTKEKVVEPIPISGILDMKKEMDVDMMNPTYGYSQNYAIIGSASAEIPMTEMVTYLASKLFENLTISTFVSSKSHQEFADYLGLSEQRFDMVVAEMSRRVQYYKIDEVVRKYFDNTKTCLNDNIRLREIINEIMKPSKYCEDSLIKNIESVAKGLQDYKYQVNVDSIPAVAFNKLLEIIEDPKKGPIYAYRMLNSKNFDVFYFLDKACLHCVDKMMSANIQSCNLRSQINAIEQKLEKCNIFNREKYIQEYINALNEDYYYSEQERFYDQMKYLILCLITEFKSINKKYLWPLKDIIDRLIRIFKANSIYFELGKGDISQDSFTKQLVKFSKIKPELDAQINALDFNKETANILKIFTEHPDVWMEGNEKKLKAMITEYIMNRFEPILSQSLENFLRKDLNMENTNNTQFTQSVENNIIKPLVNDVTPIFWMNKSIVSDNNRSLNRSKLTVSNKSGNVFFSADNYKNVLLGTQEATDIRISIIKSGIFVSKTVRGIPMYAYGGLIDYLESYENYNGLGLHMYENNPNWREILTFPYPYSLNPNYTRNAEELLKLYNDAVSKGIIYFNGANAFVKKMYDVDSVLLDIEGIRVDGKIDQNLGNQRIKVLQAILASNNGNIPINSKGNVRCGDSRIVKDNFLRFYGIEQAVRKELEKYDSLNKAIEEIQVSLQN